MRTTKLTSAINQLESISVNRLTLEQTQGLIATTHQALEELGIRAEQDFEVLSKDLADANPFVIRNAKRKLSRIQTQADYLLTLKENLEDSFQKKYMEDGMARRVGGHRTLVYIEAFILSLIVIVLGLLIYDMTAGPDTERPGWLSSNNIFLMDATCCFIFMSEFLFRLSCAHSKRFVWKHHWVDFVTSIPIPGEAQLARFGRLARLARFAKFLRLLRFARLFFFLWRGMDKLQDVMDVKMMKKTIRWSAMATLGGAFLIYQLEGTESANPVSTFGKAIWWSFTTVLTGGFGDIHNPISTSGQVLTGLLVIVGMVLVGVFTATLTSIFVGQQNEGESESIDFIRARLDELTDQTTKPADHESD
ncbi:MAG: ion transporter [Rubripirellula sp.]|nr:ion transporter [Rubripirellula sp.]